MPRSTWSSRIGVAVGTLIAFGAGLLADAARAESGKPLDILDIEGTWYVLIHYQDPKTANPDVTRWKDVVWVFKRKGTRLDWTEYPIVFFEDATGRFEQRGTNKATRVLGAWEPNAQQREELEKGPMINRRGMKQKTLSGSDERGWASSKPRPQSASMAMGYHETLTIDGLSAKPVFKRQDFVGNALTAPEGGGVEYAVEQIERRGSRLIGTYERDGRQKGSFRMWRTSPIRGLDQREREEERPEGVGPGPAPSFPQIPLPQ